MNQLSNIKKVLQYVPKRTAITFGAIAAVLIPIGLYAWGPSRTTFTMEKPSDHIAFNAITNNPDVGDERNFLRVREVGQKDWTDTVNLEQGKTYEARMYVHNNAAANLNLEANNVRAVINMPIKAETFKTAFEVNGLLSADNANPTEVWDNIVLKSDKEFHVKVVSSKYYNNIKTEKSTGFDLGNSLFSKEGALLGYEQMNGKIKGCLKYSGYVLVKFTPEFKEEAKPSYDVIKTVDKKEAKAGDTITYTLTAKNTGKTDITNVVIEDKLPAYYSEANEKVDAPSDIKGSIVKEGKVVISKLPAGKSATITVTYKIKSDVECGETNIVNKVTSSSDQVKKEDDSNNNEVTTKVNKECKPEVPPTTPPTTTGEKTQTPKPSEPQKPAETNAYTPNEIVATGANDIISGLIAMGAISGALVAYIRSRQIIK